MFLLSVLCHPCYFSLNIIEISINQCFRKYQNRLFLWFLVINKLISALGYNSHHASIEKIIRRLHRENIIRRQEKRKSKERRQQKTEKQDW